MKQFLTAIFLFIISSNLFSQGFNSISTVDGINVIAVGDNGLVFRSSNGGNSWSQNTYGSESFKSVTSVNDYVWISATNGKLFKTFKSVSPINEFQLTTTKTMNSIYFVNDQLGFVCGDDGLLFRTTDGGNFWAAFNSGISLTTDLKSVHFKDADNGVAVGEAGSVYITSNSGVTWTSLNSGTTRNFLKAKYLIDGIVISGEWGTLLTRVGVNWNSIPVRNITDITGITGTSLNNLRICGGGGFIRNNLNGSTNFFNFEKNPMFANLVDIVYYNENIGFAVSSLNKAIIRTTNGGQTWSLPSGTSVSMNWQLKLAASNGIGNNLCPHPTNRNAVFVVYGLNVYRSWNRGDNWTQVATITSGSRAHSFYVSPVDTNIWVAAVAGSPTDAVMRSTNYGQTWTTVIARNFSTYGQPLEMDQNNPSVFYFAPDGSSTGFFKSTDNGATFNNISMGTNPFTSPCDIIVEWDNSNIMFIGDDGADIHKTTNGGVTWFTVKPNSSSEIPSMCNSVFNTDICYATTWSGQDVYKTVNKGDNWNIINNTGFSGWGSDLCREDPDYVITGSYGANATFTSNGGTNWTQISTGLSGVGAGMLVVDRGLALNMQTSGMYKLNITYSVLTNISETFYSTNIPSSLNLHQNFPNPFNPSTKIRFDLPFSSDVNLSVYDYLGREVTQLINGMKQAGSYEIDFNASNMASGIYFYKLSTNSSVITKKMMLVK